LILLDVNVLIHAFRAEMTHHARCRELLLQLARGADAFGSPDAVATGFLRIVTHPRVFDPPADMESAMRFLRELRGSPAFNPVDIPVDFWDQLVQLLRDKSLVGADVQDAAPAVIAASRQSTWLSFDRGFSRFEGLRHLSPLDFAG
jgi:toxin-antitoxin system PIN domain toxin